MKKFSKKHIVIIKTILEKGYYKPAYSDQEPATTTLVKNGIAEWRGDYRGIVLTEEGKLIANQIINYEFSSNI